ncbi:hypothetical protein SAMN05444392_11078 [Seinonella peptonophila]|uniref:Uncharacterized protein n=1 Tax=Seinonella peptonophila TaxID=112248 RepID=A0A1M4ZS11_9BACL|nr:hypothetical protein [Seinonella peptonophila]SHF20705.1 hypothetical protein SAMN05444392_11078 [Seinonella peptonophila]
MDLKAITESFLKGKKEFEERQKKSNLLIDTDHVNEKKNINDQKEHPRIVQGEDEN